MAQKLPYLVLLATPDSVLYRRLGNSLGGGEPSVLASSLFQEARRR